MITIKEYRDLLLSDRENAITVVLNKISKELDPDSKFSRAADPYKTMTELYGDITEKDINKFIRGQKKVVSFINEARYETFLDSTEIPIMELLEASLVKSFFSIMTGLYLEGRDMEGTVPNKILDIIRTNISESSYRNISGIPRPETKWINRFTHIEDARESTVFVKFNIAKVEDLKRFNLKESAYSFGEWTDVGRSIKYKFGSEEVIAGWMFEFLQCCGDDPYLRKFIDSLKIDYTSKDIRGLIKFFELPEHDSNVDNIDEIFNNREKVLSASLHENIMEVPTQVARLIRTLFI